MKFVKVTFGKILVNILLSVIMIVIFSTNATLRPLTAGAIYKEFIVGGIVLVMFYSNILILYDRYFLIGKITKYILVSLLFILIAVALELLIVYPQIAKDHFSAYGKIYVIQNLVVFFILLFIRDLGLYFASFGICSVMHQYHLNAIYEQHIRNVRDEILVEKEIVKDLYPEEQPYQGNTVQEYELPEEEIRRPAELAEQKFIPSSNFTIVSNILYLEQFKNTTLLHTTEEGLCLRYSTLEKTMLIIGTSNLIRVTKSIAIMKKYLHSFDNLHVILINPNQNNLITLDWSPKYYKQALPILKEIENMKKATNSSTTEILNNKENEPSWKIPDLLQHNKINQVYYYISQHAGCKLVDISQSLTIPIPTINRILRQLKEEGLITYEGSKKTGGYRAVSS